MKAKMLNMWHHHIITRFNFVENLTSKCHLNFGTVHYEPLSTLKIYLLSSKLIRNKSTDADKNPGDVDEHCSQTLFRVSERQFNKLLNSVFSLVN